MIESHRSWTPLSTEKGTIVRPYLAYPCRTRWALYWPIAASPPAHPCTRARQIVASHVIYTHLAT